MSFFKLFLPYTPTQMYESSKFFRKFYVISVAAVLRIHVAQNLLYLAIGSTHV